VDAALHVLIDAGCTADACCGTTEAKEVHKVRKYSVVFCALARGWATGHGVLCFLRSFYTIMDRALEERRKSEESSYVKCITTSSRSWGAFNIVTSSCRF
jgi:hypothetical protein